MIDNLLISGGAVADIVTVSVFLIFILIGIHKGFMKGLLSFFGTIAALIAAFFLCKHFAAVLDNKFGWLGKISSYIEGLLLKNSKFAIELSGSAVGESLKNAGLPAFMVSIIENLPVVQNNTYPAGTTIASLAAPVIGNYVLLIASFLILFVLFKIALMFLKLFAESLKKIKIIDWADKLLGLVLGAAQGLILVCIALTVISLFPGAMSKPITAIEESKITGYLYNSDFFGKALGYVVDKGKINDLIGG